MEEWARWSLDRPTISRIVDRLREESGGGAGAILVVEDDDANREIIADLLRAEGCEVRTAANGPAALEILETWSPALILLDMRMPGMDGAAFARAYHERPGPHAPIILLTASLERASAAETIGAVGSIDKPFDVDELLGVVSQYAPCVDPPAV